VDSQFAEIFTEGAGPTKCKDIVDDQMRSCKETAGDRAGFVVNKRAEMTAATAHIGQAEVSVVLIHRIC